MDKKHWSPLDMIDFVFEIETSRAIGRHILRHTSMKFQEHSQRYSDKVIFEPIELRKEHVINRQSSTNVFNPKLQEGVDIEADRYIGALLEDVKFLYSQLIDAGVAKETARMVLPECTQTTLTVKGSLRSWLSFLNVRVEENAQKEIQEIAIQIGEVLETILPNVFSEIKWRNGLFM
jgi:thymidylate synthase (FAD)